MSRKREMMQITGDGGEPKLTLMAYDEARSRWVAKRFEEKKRRSASDESKLASLSVTHLQDCNRKDAHLVPCECANFTENVLGRVMSEVRLF